MRRLVRLILLLGVVSATGAQASPQQPAPPAPPQALRVFLDCANGCDFDYLRREITFVNWVRDRADAQVHVLVTRRASGGGSEWTLAFIGLEQFAGRDITLEYNASATNTQDEVRAGYARVLQIGLLNFVVDGPIADEIDIRHQPAARASATAVPEDDPWNFWVFRAGVSTDFEGQRRTTERQFDGSFRADRTTERWKIRSEADVRRSRQEFELNSGGVVVSTRRQWEVAGQVVRSLGPHWGASLRGAADSSSFRNQDLVLSAAPGIEYNVFPYAESSRRLLTLTYEIGYSATDYLEPTIFDVSEETLYDHSLLGQYAVTQPWGNAVASASISQFLNHSDQYRAELAGNLDFRIVRGLSIDLRGEYSVVRDQRFLPKERLTDEEILLRQRALATGYEYRLSVGFSYTFGSIFNNVVNPRFQGRRGGGFFF